jgi:2-polyprenyl-6-methoxyphenol hydroxylase-like FAD-dependent oxidoreductase
MATGMRIAIAGAGIAGPTLAYWLRRGGHEVLLVEAAPELRRGGYIIDFWGLGYDIAEKMGVLPQIRALGYQVREVRFVDARGRRRGGFSTDVLHRMTGGRFTSLRRSDVSSVIFGAVSSEIETIFGDSVTAVEPHGERVRLSFRHAPPREVDLLVGADGLHSQVRRVAFPPEAVDEVPLGYYVAACEVGGYQPRDELVYVSYSVPGRQVSRFSMRDDQTLFLFVFRDEYLAGAPPADDGERRALLTRVFDGLGWECPQIIAAMGGARELYFDRVSQIRLERWTDGRTALVGDAAACVSLLAGEGSGLAMAEAYVLAGELQRCGGNISEALAHYESRLMPFLRRKQQSAARFASSFVPRTARGIAFRSAVTRTMRVPLVAQLVIGTGLRDDITLPDYRF